MRSIINIMGCCATLVSSAQIQPTWSNIYQQGPNKSHVLNDLEVNDAGDIWLYGVADDTLGYPTGVVVKFSSFGFVEEWSHEFLDMGQASDIDIDAYNNVYVGTTDYDTIGSTSLNFMVRKIDDDGVLQWSAIRTGVGPNSYDRATALCLDGLGNTIVTGCSAQPGWTNAWLTIKYDPNGNEVWAAIHAPPTEWPGTLGGVDITTDAANNIYVTGSSHDTINGDFATVKYSPEGAELWVRREGGLAHSHGRLIRSVGDRIYVTGQFQSLDSTDVLIAAYDTAGNQLWHTIFNAPPFFPPPWANGFEKVEDLQVDGQGNVYFTGTEFAGNGIRDDYMIVKLDPNGAVLWNQHYGAGTSWDDARSMFVDDEGSVYVTGRSEAAPEGIRPLHTVKFDANGNQIWYAPYTTAYFDNYEPGEMRWDGQSNIYVASAMSGPTGRLVLLRYDISMSVKDPIPFGHMNAAPNPMTTSTTVDLSNWTGTVTCSVADAFGRTIRLTKAQGPGPMVIDRDGLAAGLYVLTFVSTERSAQLKLVIE